MKNIISFLAIVFVVCGLSAQTVDYAIVGFADANGEEIPYWILTADDDFQPRVILRNQGPAVPAATDSVKFVVTYNDMYLTEVRLLGSQLQRLTAGEQTVVDLARPIWTAAEMDTYQLMTGEVCFEVTIVGAATDPVATNNKACASISRPLAIGEIAAWQPLLYPNPAVDRVTLGNAAGARVQFFDLRGKCVLAIDQAELNQMVDVSRLAVGTYIAHFTTKNGVFARKISVVR